MKEREIDCMKYRKSTHLAGVDVETIINEKGNCILTIKDAYYQKGVDVSGNKTDGYFLEFIEDVKPMLVNSINRKTISKIVKTLKSTTGADSRQLPNWIGVTIELYFDESVKMMGQIVGGIRVKPTSPIPDISDEQAIKLLSECTTLDELQQSWGKLTGQEKALPTVASLKENLKKALQNGK
jgi:hypothetical protein